MNNYNVQKYFNKYNSYKSIASNIYKIDVPISTESGYIQINIINQNTKITTNSELTIYVNKNGNEIPILKMLLTENPTVIELPIANPEGTLIRSSEYYFTPYNLIIKTEGYYTIITRNIRPFPNIKVVFSYNLNKKIPGVPNNDTITDIPPHPRDQKYTH